MNDFVATRGSSSSGAVARAPRIGLVIAAVAAAAGCATTTADFRLADVKQQDAAIAGRITVLYNGKLYTENCEVRFGQARFKLSPGGVVLFRVQKGWNSLERLECDDTSKQHIEIKGAHFLARGDGWITDFGDVAITWQAVGGFKVSSMFGLIGALVDAASDDGVAVVESQPPVGEVREVFRKQTGTEGRWNVQQLSQPATRLASEPRRPPASSAAPRGFFCTTIAGSAANASVCEREQAACDTHATCSPRGRPPPVWPPRPPGASPPAAACAALPTKRPARSRHYRSTTAARSIDVSAVIAIRSVLAQRLGGLGRSHAVPERQDAVGVQQRDQGAVSRRCAGRFCAAAPTALASPIAGHPRPAVIAALGSCCRSIRSSRPSRDFCQHPGSSCWKLAARRRTRSGRSSTRGPDRVTAPVSGATGNCGVTWCEMPAGRGDELRDLGGSRLILTCSTEFDGLGGTRETAWAACGRRHVAVSGSVGSRCAGPPAMSPPPTVQHSATSPLSGECF
jgi:hypothetical protein